MTQWAECSGIPVVAEGDARATFFPQSVSREGVKMEARRRAPAGRRAGLLPLLLLAGVVACHGEGTPELVLHNGVVLTMNEARPEASGFAVRGGWITAVGSDDEVLALAGEGTQVIDLRGKTVVPGFNDAHLHALAIPPGSLAVDHIVSVDELVAALRDKAQTAPGRGWIVGYGYDDTALGRHLDRFDLDRVSTDRPVLAWHASLHLMAVNSHALEVAGIGPETPDPEGGFFFRDQERRPTGLLSERSALESLFSERQPSVLPHDLRSALDGLEAFYGQVLSRGITSMGDALVPPELAVAYWLSSPEEAGVRVNLMLDAESLEAAKWLLRLNDFTAWFGYRPLDNEWLRARTIKMFHGLSLSGRTARLYQPYADRPDYFGLEPQRSQEELNRLVQEIHDAGFQAAIHTNGDYEIDMVLNAIEHVVGDEDVDHRHRIAHGTVVNPEILARMRDLRVVLAPHSYVFEKGPMLEAYGEHRWDWMLPNASSFEYGIPNAGNSDFPVSAADPLLRIQSLVTRKSRQGKVYGPRQRLSVEQALYVFTMGGAYASFEEDRKGSIAEGRFADFVVLSHDPRAVPVDSISQIQVEQTYVAGVKRFDRSGSDK